MDLPTTFSSTDLMRLERASLLARYDKAPCRPPSSENSRMRSRASVSEPQPPNPNTKENAVGKRDDYYAKSTYFGADEMAGRTLKLTIAAVEDTEFETDSKTVLKPVLTFRNQEKKLVVGAMNYDRMADVFGDETKG